MIKIREQLFHDSSDLSGEIYSDDYCHEHSCGCHKCEDDDNDSCEGGSCSCCGEKEISENKFITYGILGVSALSLVLGHFDIGVSGLNISLLAVILCGFPIIKSAINDLFKEHRITTDLLITVAIVAAVAIGEQFAAAEVAFIMTVGEMLEDYTVKKTNKGLRTLINYAPKIAHLVSGEDILAKELKAGDVVIVKNGESVPVDGVITEGETTVDQSMVTGESVPVIKGKDDMVYEGSINGDGAITVEAVRSGKDSTLSRMIALVKKAQSNKAKTVKITDKIAGFIVPVSILTAIGVYAFTGEIVRAVTILVVFCPCSLVLSMPTAIMACIGRGTKMGVIIKSGQAIESLWNVDTVVTDKTGTLTYGKMTVSDVYGDEKEVISLAAGAESSSSHPIAKGVISYAREKGIAYEKSSEFENLGGMGIVCGNVLVGSRRLMERRGVDINETAEAWEKNTKGTVLFVAKEKELIGAIALSDTLRETARGAVESLNAMGVKVVMATGDNEEAAKEIAENAGIEEYAWNMLPHSKCELIERLQTKGKRVAMVGDGVNDAPALAGANTGIAMGAIGSDVAIETADIALMNDEIANIPRLIRLVRQTKATVIVNIAASVIISIGAVVFAGTGDLGPVAGALIHNAGAIMVVLNSILLFYRK